jgi:hypothetical protein
MSGIIINYPPHLIDEAIKEHIAKHMNISGDVIIDYTHRRKTRTVSATVTLNTDQIGSVKAEPIKEYMTMETPEESQAEVVSIGRDGKDGFGNPLPKEPESTESEDSDDSMFGNLPDQEASDESEDLFA